MNKGNILIVDDESHIIEMLKIELEHAGFTVFGAGNKEEAVKIVSSENIDLAFFDLGMPDADGIEIYKELKKIKPDLIGVVFTGTPEVYEKLQPEIAKCDIIDEFLRKPFRFGEVTALVEKLLRDKD